MKTFNEAVERLMALAIKVRDNTDWNDVKSTHDSIDSLSFGDDVHIEISTEVDKHSKTNGFLWFTVWNEQIDEAIDEQDSKDITDEEIEKCVRMIIGCNQVYLGLED